jgi:hypothetical protein
MQSPPRERLTRAELRIAGVLVAAALAFGILALRTSTPPPDERRPLVSLLAVGDTGAVPGWLAFASRQRAVGAALASEDARSPVDALLLLGDFFYDDGLRERELAARVRANVVAPYCRFVDLTGPRSAEVSGACAGVGAPARTRPIYAVLGNHDVTTDESRRLVLDAIAPFIANWRLSGEPASWVALAPRVSLVLFDSNRLQNGGDLAPLRDALRAAPGPWRILAAHHPIGTRSASGRADEYTDDVRAAVRDAGVPVQLMLAGHEHNLQVVAQGDRGPRLVVVSGAGSRPREVNTKARSRLFSFDDLGFVRVDLFGAGEWERLQVTLFASARWSSLLGFPPEVLGRWSLAVDGAIAVEPLEIRIVAAG